MYVSKQDSRKKTGYQLPSYICYIGNEKKVKNFQELLFFPATKHPELCIDRKKVYCTLYLVERIPIF